MKKMCWTVCIVGALLTAGFVSTLSARTGQDGRKEAFAIYVSPNGNDKNPGTKAKPFGTLEAARNAIRKIGAGRGLPKGGVTVWLRGGAYERTKTFELNERDSGTKDAPVVYRAYGDEEVRILGGRQIDPSAVTSVKDPAVRKRIISVETRDKVRQIDLKKLGIIDYGKLSPHGFGRPYVPAHLEIFVNDQAMRLARWPNNGTVRIAKVLDRGSVPRKGDFSNRGGRFTYAYDRPKYWKQAHDIWISGIFAYPFADDCVKVKSIDIEKNTISTAHPHCYGFRGGPYYALNLIEEIDVPGEYYLDRQTGILYFYPPAPMKNARIQVSMLKEPMVAMEGVSYVSLRDLTFEATRGMGIYIERGTSNLIAGCTLRNMGIVAVCIGMGISPVPEGQLSAIWSAKGKDTGKLMSRQLGIGHRYSASFFDRKAGTNHGVVGCDIYNIGAGGVHLGGGDRRTLAPGGNYVRNCHLHHFNRLDPSYKTGVNINGVGNRIEHCKIHHCDAAAIYLCGNNHVIEYNEVHDALQHCGDMGVIYTGVDPTQLGTVIRYNFFHHNNGVQVRTLHTWPRRVLYFDASGGHGATVHGNVFYKNAGSGGNIFLNRSQCMKVDNNIFIDCSVGIRITQLTEAEWQHAYRASYWAQACIKNLPLNKPPYSTRYPEMARCGQKGWCRGENNKVRRNVAYVGNKKQELISVWNGMKYRPFKPGEAPGKAAIFKDNFVTSEDPGFVDAEHMNFKLKDDSVVYKKIPGFKNIPFEKIGLYKDEYRTRLPAKRKKTP
ncbi:MAG: right-handed parallel beta-helix repeat-containing protein [Phycisphaerae bacterium]|nr:right-handed parallel beta-helix repeat-containing protein [Phycisphaerae bacterium]